MTLLMMQMVIPIHGSPVAAFPHNPLPTIPTKDAGTDLHPISWVQAVQQKQVVDDNKEEEEE